jgi:hypothetical protein
MLEKGLFFVFIQKYFAIQGVLATFDFAACLTIECINYITHGAELFVAGVRYLEGVSARDEFIERINKRTKF